MSALQIEYELLVKQNKQKMGVLAKLKKQREERGARMGENRVGIGELEGQCEESKGRAEELEGQLREELRVGEELEELIRERERELELRNREREETERKKEENRRTVNKLVTSIKSI